MGVRRSTLTLFLIGCCGVVALAAFAWTRLDRPSGVLALEHWTNSFPEKVVAVFSLRNTGVRPIQRDQGFVVDFRGRPNKSVSSDLKEMPCVLQGGQTEHLKVPVLDSQGVWRLRVTVYRHGQMRRLFEALDEQGWTWARLITAAIGRAVPVREVVSDWVFGEGAPNQTRQALAARRLDSDRSR